MGGNKKFSLIEKVNKGRKEVLFWRWEYRKRKAQKEGELKKAKSLASFVLNSFPVLLKNREEVLNCMKGQELNAVQRSVFMEIFGDTASELKICGVNVRPYLLSSNMPEEIFNAAADLVEFSMRYDYFVSDMLELFSMEKILKDINAERPLPEPPMFHANRNSHGPLPEEVLTLIRCNPDLKKRISVRDDPWEDLRTQYYERHPQYYSSRHENGYLINMCDLERRPDFIVMAQVLADGFDIDLAVNDIKGHMAWIVYDHKTKHNLPFTEKEEKAIVDFFESESKGQYGPSYAYARATSLWIWDYLFEHPELKTRTPAYDALKESNLSPYYLSSDRKTYDRLYQSAKSCIEEGEVGPIKKCDMKS